jgi:hypothetical protein
MIVQWCVKGLALDADDQARSIIDGQLGLVCNWWRDVNLISPQEIRTRLTSAALDAHVNHFGDVDPSTGRPFGDLTPFISLSCGVVERDAANRTNHVRRARQTALWFGTSFGQRSYTYLFVCWVVLAPREAVEIEGVAEEIRDLNTYRRYSDYQPEGEVTAKVIVPDNHIYACERWDLDVEARRYVETWVQPNPRFTPPERLSNVRDLI